MAGAIKLLLVDDHALFRSGVAELLRATRTIEVVGQASNGDEAVRKAKALAPDVILMDVDMPVCNGLDAVRRLRADDFKGGIIMMTVSERDNDLFTAIKNGANGYLLKNAEIEEVVSAVIHTARGETVISPLMATKLIREFKSEHAQVTPSPADNLSDREEEVLRLVANGATNKEIAESLYITENTVKSHMQTIMSKLQFKSRYQVITYAVKRGLAPA